MIEMYQSTDLYTSGLGMNDVFFLSITPSADVVKVHVATCMPVLHSMPKSASVVGYHKTRGS